MEVNSRVPHVLCCQCGVAIPANPLNTCADCLQTRYDIGAGVAKQVQQHTCRGCERYERRDGSWAAVEPESKELLALLLRKPRGLASVRLADASFVWTEPHSKRIKLRVTIQKEVVAGALLQQTFIIEYVIGNKQCPHCQRREAKDTWNALVQVRQKVPHKRTFLWVEQLILRHQAHEDTVNILEVKDGLDFFFDQRSHAEKLVSFLQSVAPTRYKISSQVSPPSHGHPYPHPSSHPYPYTHPCSLPHVHARPALMLASAFPRIPIRVREKSSERTRWRCSQSARTTLSGCRVPLLTLSDSPRSLHSVRR